MKLVIDIPDYDIEQIKEYYEGHDTVSSTYSYIYHGQPLSEILDKISAEIKIDLSGDMFDGYGNETRLHKELMEIIEKYKGDKE